MLIGIDASKTANEKKTGIDNTAYQIILGLTDLDKTNTYFLYTNKSLDPILLKNSNFKEKLIPFPRLWNRFRLPLALLKDKPDLFIELTSSIPSLAPDKTIVLIHDLAFKYFPEAYSKYELMLQENAIEIAKAKASAIVFTGKANLADFIKFYGQPKAKTVTIPLGYNLESISEEKNVKKEDWPYFLSVGRLEKRKNTVNIIRAFDLFKSQNQTNHKLILVGQNGFGAESVEDEISNSKFKNDIIRRGHTKKQELTVLYRNTEALLYPSLYEGFGLPILEAMASGAPVITSNIPTIKEVAKEAALYVGPEDLEDIAGKMKSIVSDKALRKEKIINGYQVVKNYSWQKTAESFYELILEIGK